MTMRSVCFTIFEHKEPDWNPQILQSKEIDRAIVQKEKCPETGQVHFQGFLMLKSPARLAGIKKLLQANSAHLEKAKGTPTEAWEYCKKEESRVEGPWTFGTPPKSQGSR